MTAAAPRVLTIRQPWASLIQLGVKRVETRTRPTPYRGSVFIHAAKRPVRTRETIGDWEVWPPDTENNRHPNHPNGRPARLYQNSGGWLQIASWCPLLFGAVIAVADLTDCLPIVQRTWPQEGPRPSISAHGPDDPSYPRLVRWNDENHVGVNITDQFPYGDFTPGRWAWMFDNVQTLPKPIPWNGMQGFPSATEDLTRRVESQLTSTEGDPQ